MRRCVSEGPHYWLLFETCLRISRFLSYSCRLRSLLNRIHIRQAVSFSTESVLSFGLSLLRGTFLLFEKANLINFFNDFIYFFSPNEKSILFKFNLLKLVNHLFNTCFRGISHDSLLYNWDVHSLSIDCTDFTLVVLIDSYLQLSLLMFKSSNDTFHLYFDVPKQMSLLTLV